MTFKQWQSEIKRLLGATSLRGYAKAAELRQWYDNLLDPERVAQMLRDRVTMR